MADDPTQVTSQIINEHLNLIGYVFQDIHINTTTGTTPSHDVEQGTYTGDFGVIQGSFTFTSNNNHVTEVADSIINAYDGSTYEIKSTYTGTASGYNLVSQEWINGISQGIFHTSG